MSETKDPELIPFNCPHYTGDEEANIQLVMSNKSRGLSGNGKMSELCHKSLQDLTGSPLVLLTHSGTAALEMCAIMCDLQPYDEVILPSYTFVSSANAFALRGAVPVFVDIALDGAGITAETIQSAITEKTRVICVVHYAGIACAMDEIMTLAKAHNLIVIEDAAHSIGGRYKSRMLGSIGDFGAFSFHETKNIQCGEGGAILVNNQKYLSRAHVIWEKGTNRRDFIEGLVPKYSWMDIGSSFLPSELTAAFLYAQLQMVDIITKRRVEIWNMYYAALKPLHHQNKLRLPIISEDSVGHCAHIFFFYTNTPEQLKTLIARASERRICLTQHYVPLHSSPHGSRIGRVSGSMKNTTVAARTLVRLPLWCDMTDDMVQRVIDVVVSIASDFS